ncbi:MAG: hypothetical protein GKR87_10160 [Kiritimatiellae bacterium]|nr:hypothetical protein [Kiritimatiellia bacterium]
MLKVLSSVALCSAFIFLFLTPFSSCADELDQEFRFVSGLVEWGFPDFADKVMEQLQKQYPGQKDRMTVVQAQVLIRRRKFSEAEALIKRMPSDSLKVDAINIALANAYYGIGETEKAGMLYKTFFNKYKTDLPTDPDLLRLFQETAYEVVQRLKLAGDLAGAAQSYEMFNSGKS